VLLFARVPVAGVAWLRIFFAAARVCAVAAAVARVLCRLGAVARHHRGPRRRICHNELLLLYGDRSAAARPRSRPSSSSGRFSWRSRKPDRTQPDGLVAATAGVYVLVDVRWTGAPAAFAWAFINAGLFMLYIVLAHAVANSERASVRSTGSARRC